MVEPIIQILKTIYLRNSGLNRMKYLIILGDGMADRPIKKLSDKTPLEIADTPHLDLLAKNGCSGLLKTIPDKMPSGSSVANLSVMGYNPVEYFSGRGVLEAANIGVTLSENDLSFRCNLVCIEQNRMKNHSAGHISTSEADKIIKTLNNELGNEFIKFYTGTSYKHLLTIRDGINSIKCYPPHDYPNELLKKIKPEKIDKKGESTAALLNSLIADSNEILKNHPVNITRISEGKSPANSIWPWSPGKKSSMPSFKELYNLSGAVISAVDLIKGIGIYAGMDIIDVEGATGLYTTNYEGKADAALKALLSYDFVYLHIEASDEAGHEGDIDLKVKTIEYLDNRVVKRILSSINDFSEPVTIALLPDHPTPAELRIHTREPVPFVIVNPELAPDNVSVYNEESAKKGFYGTLEGTGFIKTLIGQSS